MTTYLVFAHYKESSKYDQFYLITQPTMQEAAHVVWEKYKKRFDGFDEPEDWEVVVAECALGVTPLSIGNFETGWMDVPSQSFSGETLP